MKLNSLALFAATASSSTLGLTVQTFAQGTGGQIITFDASLNAQPPASINPSGEITGNYSDASGISHGFVRD